METLIKNCRLCGKQFTKPSRYTYKKWSGRFCCSKECGDKSKKTPWLVKHQIQKGQSISPETQFKSHLVKMENNINWKGDKASYEAKHIWMAYHFGRPNYCEHCKTTRRRMYHWANVSGEYKRDKSDWLRLCVPCHKKFDQSK